MLWSEGGQDLVGALLLGGASCALGLMVTQRAINPGP